jgi:DNA-binding transcriptional MerR regulator
MDVYEKVEGVAKLIGVSPSTVKKYYTMFEQEGYRFKRNNEGHILFSNYEIDLLKELIVLKNQPGMTLPNAVKQIAEMNGMTSVKAESETTTLSNETEGLDGADMSISTKQIASVMAELVELKQLIKEQNELVKLQQAQLESMKQRDVLMVQSLKQAMVERIVLNEIAANKEKEDKKDFFARLFGK